MRRSLTSAIFAAALLCECYALSAASPMGKADGGGGSLEQEAYASLLSNEASESDVGNGDVATAGKSGGPRVIVVADPSLWRELLRGGAPRGGLSVFKRRTDDNGQLIERRDAGRDLNIPILRRDPMRCMVGRLDVCEPDELLIATGRRKRPWFYRKTTKGSATPLSAASRSMRFRGEVFSTSTDKTLSLCDSVSPNTAGDQL
ncbi:Pro-MCH [Liparis tanakae]|uniref:Pro-MCH n=1 Tax=Liparis tanakae TaxID=230148 RepID=A0A4Z2F769_9TELE|nr:Pro-MCH [Liparis tanakae]